MKSGINKLGTLIALTALLAALLLATAAPAVASSVPQPPSSWQGVGCMRYETAGADNIVCLYDGTPFQLTGTSKGGASTLIYAVQCQKLSLPWEKQVGERLVYPKVWFKASKSVSGSFKVLGKKAALNAAMAGCNSSTHRNPVLIASLKKGAKANRASLTGIKQSGSLPWGKTPKKPNYRLAVNIFGPSTVTNDGSSTYVYKLPVSNTGKLKIGHAKLHFTPIGLVSGSSVHWSSSGNVTLSNLKAGHKKTITVRLNPQASTASSWNLKFTAKGLGTAKKASASASEAVDVTTVTTTTG
ncbi:MAG: hypothetical protein WBQ14_03020 [Gaiellaceae bacterium]